MKLSIDLESALESHIKGYMGDDVSSVVLAHHKRMLIDLYALDVVKEPELTFLEFLEREKQSNPKTRG